MKLTQTPSPVDDSDPVARFRERVGGDAGDVVPGTTPSNFGTAPSRRLAGLMARFAYKETNRMETPNSKPQVSGKKGN